MSEEQEPLIEQTEESQAPPQPVFTVEEKQGLIRELQESRAQSRQIQAELHEHRQASLRQQYQAPPVDPVDTALQSLKAKNDPALVAALEGILRPVLSELYQTRTSNSQQAEVIERIQAMQREVSVNQQLSQTIPDIATIGPDLLKLLEKYPQATQQMYVNNPALLQPLADQVRSARASGKQVAKVAADRARTGMDTGPSDSGFTTTADAMASMRPESKEFAKIQADFWK